MFTANGKGEEYYNLYIHTHTHTRILYKYKPAIRESMKTVSRFLPVNEMTCQSFGYNRQAKKKVSTYRIRVPPSLSSQVLIRGIFSPQKNKKRLDLKGKPLTFATGSAVTQIKTNFPHYH